MATKVEVSALKLRTGALFSLTGYAISSFVPQCTAQQSLGILFAGILITLALAVSIENMTEEEMEEFFK
jgi:hypothetical protein